MNAHVIPQRRRVELTPSTTLQKVSAAIDKHHDALAIMRLAEVTARQLADELGRGSGDLAASVSHSLELIQLMIVEVGTALELAEVEIEKAGRIGRVSS